ENQDEAQDVEIMPTDIVFDCPHCGHNLVVDYRAAGLQVPCPSCGSIIQAPIPEGMHLEDLDCDPGELLQQLLQTRRMLVKAESAAQQMGDKIANMMELIADYRKTLLAVKARVETLQEAADLANATRQDVIDLIASVGSK
ncbi:MAG: hypothetical protein RSD41_02815, partial [Kiritimatiellia bacterium]